MTATGYDSRSNSVGTTHYEKGYHAILSADKTYSWTRKTSAYSVTIKVTTKNTYTGSSGSKSVTFTVPALTKYTITYNANGGSGAPGATYKYYGQNSTLSSTKPTRTGYTFLGWSMSSTATSATWAAGGTYSTNASDTLYAVWKANTYTITYNANGGSGAPSSQTKTYDKALILTSTKPTRTHYTFLGWSTSSTATAATYAAGASFDTNITSNTTLYAVWKEAYIPPSIKITAKRTTSEGADDDEGTYAVAIINWTNGSMSGTPVTPTELTVQCSLRGANTWSTVYTKTSSITSPLTTSAFRNGSADLLTESQYDIRVTITDAYDSTTESTFISKAEFVLDVNEDGTGIAIGAACSRTGFSTSWDMWMDNAKGFYCAGTNGLWYNMIGANTSDTFHFGYGGYNNDFGNTYYNGNNIYVRSKKDITLAAGSNNVYVNGYIIIPNERFVQGIDAAGNIRNLLGISNRDNCLISYGPFVNGEGYTYLYGYNGLSIRTSTFDLVTKPITNSDTYDGTFYPSVAGTITLGQSANRWYRLYQEYASVSTSDKRCKENIKRLGSVTKKRVRVDKTIEEYDPYSELFDRLEPVEYNFINGQKRKDFGLLAQDVLAAMNDLGIEEDELDLVHHDTWIDEETGEKKDSYGIAYENLIALLISEVQKLKRQLKRKE
jgi:uncharacterized repeat protein (TIGR02543 family)